MPSHGLKPCNRCSFSSSLQQTTMLWLVHACKLAYLHMLEVFGQWQDVSFTSPAKVARADLQQLTNQQR